MYAYERIMNLPLTVMSVECPYAVWGGPHSEVVHKVRNRCNNLNIQNRIVNTYPSHLFK